MNNKDLLDKTINEIKNSINTVGDKYDNHIKEKARKEVDKKIKEKGIDIDQIDSDDYEAMIDDLSKDIKNDYSKKAGQGLMAFIGLDLLLGW